MTPLEIPKDMNKKRAINSLQAVLKIPRRLVVGHSMKTLMRDDGEGRHHCTADFACVAEIKGTVFAIPSIIVIALLY